MTDQQFTALAGAAAVMARAFDVNAECWLELRRAALSRKDTTAYENADRCFWLCCELAAASRHATAACRDKLSS